MWVIEIVKEMWAAYKARKAAKAAADLPAGKVAVDSIAKDGDDIRSELTKTTPAK